ncbi:hypothetical protein COY33_02370 [candidate division WWE3 bacterium CG_4_10_14_0_2_um_filter_42_7]|uniref:DUF5615 domain-containing protein n=2 Tax=Katanobacteria TaxID=422282 RepID=A0A2H0X8Z3_UNCKA|nr:MAG: hypothetical protein COT51_03055 [candidate division WWE3 bacterium CG08_land_8_20_14_0_20_41_15]PIZ42902.1 MAG: hypothetical protein COY33_02370 [candidate division WWE3 bacterium CG_4_10_14_0_2_um_filter_42_7]
MLKLLLDANISPETARFIRSLNINTKSLIEENLSGITDEEVVALAKKEKQVILTFDFDFGYIYQLKEQDKLGVVVLRIKDQTVESANSHLERFFNYIKQKKLNLSDTMAIIEEDKYRIHQKHK